RTVPECPRPVLHPSVKPGNDVAFVNASGDLRGEVRRLAVGEPGSLQFCADVCRAVDGAKVDVAHRFAYAAQPGGVQGNAGATATVAHVRINERALDCIEFVNALVHLHIRCYAAGQHDGRTVRRIDPVAHNRGGDGLENLLVRGGDIDRAKV